MRQDFTFFHSLRVRYNEVDQQGIVYNGNYLIYTDVAFCEFMRAKNYPYQEISLTTGFEVCHIKSSYEFKASAFSDDLLDIGVRTLRIGTKSFTLGFEVFRAGEDEPLVLGECVYTGYLPATRSSAELTPRILEMLNS